MVPQALVVMRRPRGAEPPGAAAIIEAITADRGRLREPPAPEIQYRLAGPYAIEVGGEALDEWVAWEV